MTNTTTKCSVNTYLNAGELLINEGKIKEAQQIYLKATETIIDSSEIYLKLGDCYRKSKEWDNSITYFQKSLEVDPDNYWTWCKLGQVLYSNKKIDRAIECYEKAIKIDDSKAFAYQLLGLTIIDLDQWKNSLKFIKKADSLRSSKKSNHRKHSIYNEFYWRLLARTSKSRFDLNISEIKTLKEVRENASKDKNSLLDYLIHNAETRFHNQAELSNYKYKVISLGNNCFPRTVCTRWGLKFPRVMGEYHTLLI